MNSAVFALLALVVGARSAPEAHEARATLDRPALVVLVTIDQLRGDALPRLRERFGKGGFKRLLERGVWFADAHYHHATTLTAVGHATLATGSTPSAHGLVGNDWAERETGRRVYCCEDPAATLIGGGATPAHAGTSPRNLVGTTIGDELVLATAGRARAFSVSIKDRGAILPGGALGKALWYASRTGGFQSSSYYYDDLPEWVVAWNAAGHAARYAGATWELARPLDEYDARELDHTRFARAPAEVGARFPHVLPATEPFSALRFTPFGDELTVDFALELVEREELGRRDVTDFLAISLSCTDYIGHAFGPSGLEAEDNLLRVDATLARFFDALDASIGLERTLIALCSDHGVDALPEYRHELTCAGKSETDGWVPRADAPGYLQHAVSGLACCAAGRQDPGPLLAAAERNVRERLGIEDSASWLRAFWTPNLYLDPVAVEASGLSLERAARLLAAELERHPSVEHAVTRDDLLTDELPRSAVLMRLRNSFHTERSGDVLLVTAPGWYLITTPDAVAGMHGSAWAYDTHVPILFAGPGVPAGREVHRRVAPADIAPTIAALLGIEPPSMADGEVLVEVVGER